jgi:hypothetical protein
MLTIRGSRQDGNRNKGGFVKAPPGLLDLFLSLADASNRLSRMMTGDNPADEKISRFAKRYGGLEIFYEITERSRRLETEHSEYCCVWHYFAGALRALLRIGAELYQGRIGLKEDWQVFSAAPPVMRRVAHASRPNFLYPFVLGDEETWLALAHFVAKPPDQDKVMFGHLVNTLLGLGGVRPWMTWSDLGRGVARPQIAYFGRSLFSTLAIQFCLRLAKVDSFLLCTHCREVYWPVGRAPKTGQRNFCPGCRRAGIRKKYACGFPEAATTSA